MMRYQHWCGACTAPSSLNAFGVGSCPVRWLVASGTGVVLVLRDGVVPSHSLIVV